MIRFRVPSRRLLLAAVLFAPLGCSKGTLTVTLDQAEIQQRVSAVFPIQREAFLARVTLQNPVVVLREGSDRIGLDLEVRLALPLLPEHSGKVAASGKLAYRPTEKAFYLEQPAIDRLEIPGVSATQTEELRRPAEAVIALVLPTLPVYQLAQRDAKEVAAEHVLKSVAVKNGRVEAEIGLPGK